MLEQRISTCLFLGTLKIVNDSKGKLWYKHHKRTLYFLLQRLMGENSMRQKWNSVWLKKYTSVFPKLLRCVLCITHNFSAKISHFSHWNSSVYHNSFGVFSHFEIIHGPASILSLFLSTVSLWYLIFYFLNFKIAALGVLSCYASSVEAIII